MNLAPNCQTEAPNTAPYKSFSLVFAGGGARGLAHAGVLFALERYGYRPGAIVGVSMGAIVGVTYALNRDWYAALVNMDVAGFPSNSKFSGGDLRSRIRDLIASELILQEMLFGWGIGTRRLAWGKSLLRDLTLGRKLEDGRVATSVIATDLYSGCRVVIDEGNAADAAYASAALAGILPPFAYGDYLLADGCYTDLIPIDVARRAGTDIVIVVDPEQSIAPSTPSNGVEAMLRATEICQREHAVLRLRQADFVLRPDFGRPIDTLEFRHKRVCVAAGIRAVRDSIHGLRELLRHDAA